MKKYLWILTGLICLVLAGSAASAENPSQAELNARLQELQGRLENIQKQQTQINHSLDQLRIQGRGFTNFRQLQITGPGAEAAVDFLGRPLWYDPVETDAQLQGSKANQRFNITIAGKPTPQVELRGDLKANIIWVVPDEKTQLTMDNFSLRTDVGPWKAAAGTFCAAFSPLTIYYPRFYAGFESELFSNQRSCGMGSRNYYQHLRENSKVCTVNMPQATFQLKGCSPPQAP